VVHGTHDVVNMMLDHPDIKAISFVGSDQAGKHIYTRWVVRGGMHCGRRDGVWEGRGGKQGRERSPGLRLVLRAAMGSPCLR
jgi:hypothetical protein